MARGYLPLLLALSAVWGASYGAVLPSEPPRLGARLGQALILAGVPLGSGMVRLPRRPGPDTVPSELTP